VQEAKEKKHQLSDTRVEWHMIGHLQRNKAQAALGLFDVIESLDNLALLRELDKEAAKRNTIARTFVEVNLAGKRVNRNCSKETLPVVGTGREFRSRKSRRPDDRAAVS
jgi:uncharacterized pyridoxal phosphate-containing UPF0001 family protein